MAARPNSAAVNDFIVNEVELHPKDIVEVTSKRFGISPEAVRKRIRALVADGWIEVSGRTKDRSYAAKLTQVLNLTIPVRPGLAEDLVWSQQVSPAIELTRKNVRDISYYGFTEIFNNAIDHASADAIRVEIFENPYVFEINIVDDGIGIFKKIKSELNLDHEREAILQLSKGKFTTDPEHHSGQGIFFASRMFDLFSIVSGNLLFFHKVDENDWIVDSRSELLQGTWVGMKISKYSERIASQVFDQFAPEDSGFSKTRVPLSLAIFGTEGLVSRSQAKRVLAGFDKFEEVVLDFEGVPSIGQAFADEIFRVFCRQNPNVKLRVVRGNESVNRMIRHVQNE